MAKKADEKPKGTVKGRTGARKVKAMTAAGTGEFSASDRKRLREAAEELLKSGKARVRAEEVTLNEMAEKDLESIIHELWTYQEELEIQNEELRTAQQQIEESRSRYAELYEFAPVGYFTLDKNGNMLEANLTGAQMLGVERSILVKGPFTRFIDDADREIFRSHVRMVFESSVKQTCELRIRKGNGALFHALLESIRSADTGKDTYRATLTDITDRKRAEDALRMRNEELETIFKTVPIGIALANDPEGMNIRGNPALERMTGVQPGGELSKRGPLAAQYRTLHDGVELRAEELPMQRAVRGETVTGQVMDLEREDGRIVRLYCSCAPLYDPNGQPRGAIGAFLDITEMARAEEVLLRQNEELEAARSEAINEKNRLDAVMQALPVGVVIMDSQGGVISSNATFKQVWGGPRPRTEKVSDYGAYKAWWAETGQQVQPEEWASARAVQKGETVIGQLIEIERFDGTRASVVNSAAPVRDAVGNIIGSAVAIQDVTALRQVQQEREIAVKFLRLVNQTTGTADLIRTAAIFFQEQSGCQAVGIRLKEGDDYPYYEARGFPKEFLLAENSLCARDSGGNVVLDSSGNPVIECMCGNVICGRFDPSKPFFTKGGSFWTNCTTELFASTSEAERQARTRNRCNGKGYESVALLPLCTGTERLGLLQLNDRRKGMFSPRLIALWERLASYLAVALAKARAEEALRRSERRLSAFATATFEGIVQSESGRIVDCNGQFARMMGSTVDELKGASLEDLVAPEDRGRVMENIRLNRESFVEHGMIRKDGARIIVETHGSSPPLLPADPRRYTALRDVTERKEREEELRQLNRTLKALSDSSHALIHAVNESDYLKEVCRIVVEDCGHSMVWIGFAEDDEDKTVRPVAHAGFGEGYLETLKITWADTERGRGPTGTAVRTGRPNICSNMLTDPLFGPWREEALKRGYASSLVVPLLEGGKAFGVINIYSEQPDSFSEEEAKLLGELAEDLAYGIVSIRLRRAHELAEAALRQSEERYRRLVEMSPDAVFVNRGNRIEFVNPAGLQLFGAASEKQLLGRSPFEIFEPGYHPIMRERIHTLLGGRSVPSIECRIVRLDGKMRDVEVAAAPFDDAEGRAIQVILRDITERKLADEQLRRSKERFELLSATSGKLLSNGNPHEIVYELCKKVLAHLDCQVFFNFLVDEDSKRLRLNAYAGISDEDAREIEWLDYGAAVCGAVASDGQRIIAENIPEVRDPRTDLVRSFGIKAYACHPLLSQGRVIGTLSFGTSLRPKFTDDELELMRTVTDQVAISMERVNFLKELERAVDERTAELTASREQLSNTIESITDGFFMLNDQWQFIYMNSKAEKIWEMAWEGPVEGLIGANLRELPQGAVNPVIYEQFSKAVSDQVPVFFEVFLHIPGRWFDVRAYPTKYGLSAYFKDISERKKAEERDMIRNEILELFARKGSLKEYLDAVVTVINGWSGCRCVCIRVVNEQGLLPCKSYVGFSPEFCNKTMLSLDKDTCRCVRAVTGMYGPQDAPIVTPYGSLYINNSQEFAAGLPQQEPDRDMGACMRHGFLSIALVPIRYWDRTVGLVHLADERKGMATLRNIEFLESLTPLIGEAIFRFSSEESLRKSRALLSEAQRIGHMGNWVWDVQTDELSWSDEIYRIFGLKPGKSVLHFDDFLQLVHPDDRDLVTNAIRDSVYRHKPYCIEHRIVLPDGVIRTVHEQGEVRYDDGIPTQMAGIIQDFTERKKTEENLRASRERIRKLFAHLQRLSEKERTRIAREIHDEFGSMLTALKIDLSLIGKRLRRDQAPLLEQIGKNMDLINAAIKMVQRISSDLRPPILDHFGLGAAIEWQVKEFGNRTGIRCEMDIEIKSDLERDLSTAVFRILQETLTNIMRHAEASEVNVTLKEQDGFLTLEVSDNGKGISNGEIADPGSFGLTGIRERVLYLGGHIEIRGEPKKGTTVTATIPIE
jgi:PAS domain S-box-containing protein